MIRVTCKQCGASSGIIQGSDPRHADVDSAVVCGCCTQDHHHGQAANTCPGDHPGAPCPEPDPAQCLAVTPEGEPCPGEHCGLGVDGCAVCRPVNIEILLAEIGLG